MSRPTPNDQHASRAGAGRRRRMAAWLLACVATLGLLSASAVERPAPRVWPPPLAPAAERADEIRVDKSDRLMELRR